MSDFSDRDFAAGSLVGLRAFNIDNLGRLTGVSYKEVWTPGVNEAKCLKSADEGWLSAPITFRLLPGTAFYGGIGGAGGGSITYEATPASLSEEAVASKVVEPPHVIAGLSCKCGFYAYFDGGNDYRRDSYDGHIRVGGIVEGWGVCTVGSRGFRASKARLLALVIETADSAHEAALHRRLARNYPDLPVYTSELEAVAAHPLTESELPTPDDADFWTRSAS